ncbi:MAG: hypothetical protein ACPGJV_03330 [Bacteriovoracaceae bacterium]
MLKQRLIISIFVGLNLFTIGFSVLNKDDGRALYKNDAPETKPDVSSFLNEIKFYTLKNSTPTLELKSKELIKDENTGLLSFFGPDGIVYNSKTPKQNIYFSGRLGFYYQKEAILKLRNDSKFKIDELNLSCDEAIYHSEKARATCKHNVKTVSHSEKTGDTLNINSDWIEAYPEKNLATYKGKVEGELTRKKRYEHPVYFKSQEAKVNLNDSLITLNDEVWLKRLQVTGTANKGEIFLENYNKKLKYFTLNDDVKLKEIVKPKVGGKQYLRTAVSEKLEGIVSENLLVLTGFPKVYQFKDIIRGNRIVLRKNTEVVEVEDANTSFFLDEEETEKEKQ